MVRNSWPGDCVKTVLTFCLQSNAIKAVRCNIILKQNLLNAYSPSLFQGMKWTTSNVGRVFPESLISVLWFNYYLLPIVYIVSFECAYYESSFIPENLFQSVSLVKCR